jgi:hypothetical protein
MRLDNIRRQNNVTKPRLSQTDPDCLSQDFTVERNRAKAELARKAPRYRGLFFGIAVGFLLEVVAVGLLTFFFHAVRLFLIGQHTAFWGFPG